MTTPTDQQPTVSLARLAELDAAASEGPWVNDRGIPRRPDGVFVAHGATGADAQFIAASKGFAPALVKRLEARLEAIQKWRKARHPDPVGPLHAAGMGTAYDEEERWLRALIRGEGEA